MRFKALAFGMVGYVALAANAAAQVAPTIPTVEARRIVHGSLGVVTTFDDNIAHSSKAVAALRGLEPQDITARPQVSLDIVQPLGRQMVFLRGFAGYDFHRENKRLDRPKGDIQGGYVTSLGICQALVSSGYQVSQSDISSLDTPGVENLAQRTSIAVGTQCGRARGFSGGASVQRLENHNSAAIQATSNSTVESLALQLGYGNPTFGQVGVAYNYTTSAFGNRIIPGRPVGDGFFTQTFAVIGSHRFGSRLNVNLGAGRTTVKREFAPTGTPLKFVSTTYSGALAYKLGSRWNFDLTGGRAVVPTARAGKLYDISTTGRFTAKYKLGARISLAGGHYIEDIKSNADTSIPLMVITNTRLNSTFASVAYSQSERVRLSLAANYDDRNTNLPEFDYKATRIILSVEVGF